MDNFESIKSQYEKIQIKGNLIISNEKRTGISSDYQSKFYIITQHATFNETALKWCAKHYQLHGPIDEIYVQSMYYFSCCSTHTR